MISLISKGLLVREFSLFLHKGSEEFAFPHSFCNKNSSHSQRLWNNEATSLHTFFCFVVLAPQSMSTIFSLKFFLPFLKKLLLYLMNVHSLGRGALSQRAFFLSSFHYTIISYQTFGKTQYFFFFAFTSLDFFQTRKPLLQFWPWRPVSWQDCRWQHFLAVTFTSDSYNSPFPELNGNLETIVTTQ